MEINNKNTDFKKHPPQQHQIIFFSNPPQQYLNKHQSNEIYDEQEMPLNNADDEDIDEMESYTPVQKKIFTVEKTSNNMSQQYQPPNRRAEIHQSSIGMRHPLNSSELFNAFSKENQRENKTMININKSQWTDNSSHTPNSLRNEFSRIQNQTYLGGMTNKKLEQSHFLDQKKPVARNFFGQNQQMSKSIDEFNEMNQDQEYQMTDQDFDGHDDQQVQDEELYSAQDQDLDDQNDRNDEEEQEADEDVHSQEDEGNIPQSSTSVSPDDKVAKKNINLNPNQIEYFSNIIEENDEENRESNVRSSNQTTSKYSASALFNQKVNNNVIIERNDRFVVYKMIPQANSTSATKQSHISMKDQPTPTISDRNNQIKNIQSNKFYSETVEDVNSSDSDNQEYSSYSMNQQKNFYPQKQNQGYQEQFQSPTHHMINLADDSLFEEARNASNEANNMRNKIVQSQPQLIKKLEKPPMSKKSDQTTPNLQSNQKSSRRELIVSPNYVDSGKTQIDSISKNRNVQKLSDASFEDAKKSLDNDFKKQQIHKSQTGESKSSSGRFKILNKLERKNITEENVGATFEFNLTNNNSSNLNNLIQYSQGPNTQHDNFLLQTQEIVEPIKINERRQSDSAVLQLQMINVQTQNTATQMTHSTIDNQNNKEHLDNKLLEQYKQLKRTMNNQDKSKKANQKDSRPLNNNLLISKQVQGKQNNVITQQKHLTSNNNKQQQNKNQRQLDILNDQRAKGQKNYKQENDEQNYKQQFNSGNLMSSYLSDGRDEDQTRQGSSKIAGLLSVQQSTKAKDGRNKNLFINNNEQNSRTANQKDRQISNNRLQQKISPIRPNNQKIQNQKQAKAIQSNKRRNNEDSEDQSSQSSKDNTYIQSKKKQNQHQQTSKANNNQKKKQQVTEKRKHKVHSDSEEYYDEQSHSNEDSQSDDNSRSQSQAYQTKSYRQKNRSESQDSEESQHDNESDDGRYRNVNSDDEDDDDYGEDQELSDYSRSEQSVEYSRSEGSSDSKYNSSPEYVNNYNQSRKDQSHNLRPKQHHNKHKSQSRQRQTKKVVKQIDRKQYKININMPGDKHSKQKSQNQIAQEEYLLKQRQLLQQQQHMIQMAQYPQQQFMLQQQLALQQQMLMNPLAAPLQPPLPQQTFYNPTNIQSTINLGVGGLQNQAQVNYDHMQMQTQRHQQQQQQQQQYMQQLNPHSSKIDDSSTNRNLRRNISGNSINQMNEQFVQNLNFGQKNNESISPKRDIMQNNFQPQTNRVYNNPMLLARSPRDISANNSYMRAGQEDFSQYDKATNITQISSQQNYLHQIKNRFKTGGNSSIEQQPSQYEMEDNQQSFNQMSSRNNKIIPNKSSPLQRFDVRDQWRERPEQDQRFNERNVHMNQRFEEARNFQLNEQRNLDYSMNQQHNYDIQLSQKHTRTTSYIDYSRDPEYRRSYDENENEEQEQQNQRRLIKPRNLQQYEDYEQQASDLSAPNLAWKKTGDFAQDNLYSKNATPRPNKEDISPIENKNNRSPSGDPKDLSVDEGVKASMTRHSLQKSPQEEEFSQRNDQKRPNQLSKKDTQVFPKQNQIEVDRPSLIKQQSHKNDNKKGAESLWIGFDDDNQVSDPFQNKPNLKSRDKTQEQRSKSSKPTEINQSNPAQTQKRVPFQRQKDRQKDMQLGSPIRKEEDIKLAKQTPNQTKPVQNTVFSESPLKKAVKDIQVKQHVKNNQNTQMQSQNQASEEEDIKDPDHNKGIVIEIFDKKLGKLPQQEVSLAEMFKAKRKEAIGKQEIKQKQDQDLQVAAASQESYQDKPAKKGEKSKEELAELRKLMMKSKVKRKDDNQSKDNAIGQDGMANGVVGGNDAKKQKGIANENLMMRLAMGKKVQVDKKEMKKLTSKNYYNLPEIKKKKEEEQKRLENAARKAAAADYMKQFNEKRKQMLKKKKSTVNDGGDDD
ncbi:UNKNOWN [Stylonychia lemnae]|uniref:Uncharacterized protein n=1 Tax=Stylonychia lemnae TaxID=5949 RepID=A0A078AHV5_STYLE|nr:UNKNOWN [Stylonychia lemnae]|eukprot:CDW80373.1 UNKNOWN [Stylonychia lemnae]